MQLSESRNISELGGTRGSEVFLSCKKVRCYPVSKLSCPPTALQQQPKWSLKKPSESQPFQHGDPMLWSWWKPGGAALQHQELKVTGIPVHKNAFPVELGHSQEDREGWRERVQIKLHFQNWLFYLFKNFFLFLFYKNLSIQYFFLCVWLIRAVFLISAPISTTLCLSFNAEKEDRTQERRIPALEIGTESQESRLCASSGLLSNIGRPVCSMESSDCSYLA